MFCWAVLAPWPAHAQNAAAAALPMTAAETAEQLKKAAAGGNAIAKLHLADRYRSGDGVFKDLARASVLFHEAAELGVARAQATLGWMYLEGDGAPRDTAAALKWFEAAAAQGDAYSLSNLGRMYRLGIGVPKDEEGAWKFLSRAAELQDPDAMTGVAMRMLAGPPEQRNPPRAIRYLAIEKAAADSRLSGGIGLMKSRLELYRIGQAYTEQR